MLEQKLLKLHLQIVLETRSLQPKHVQLECTPEQMNINFIGEDASQNPLVLKTIAAPTEVSQQALTFFLDRVFFWPDLNDDLFVSNPGKIKRLLIAPNSQARLAADFSVVKKIGSPTTEMNFSNIQVEHIPALEETLLLEQRTKEHLARALKNRSGLVLAHHSEKPHSIDSVAVLLALRPDACFFRHVSSERSLGEAVQLAESNFVIVGTNQDDPVEMAINAQGMLANKPELVEQFIDRLRLCFVHTRVRRVCASCARSTPLAPQTLDKLPIQLRAKAKNSYMFGRGCEQCGHSAYRGTIGLTSLAYIGDEIRGLLRDNAPATQLTRALYLDGTRSLLEDGLARIFSGLTSFEEVLAVAPRISAAFNGAIAAEDRGSEGTGSIEAIEAGSFETQEALFPKAPSAVGKTKQKVLVVEDDNDQRAVLETVLRSEGYEVIGAENGQTALNSLKKSPVDLIICDVMMPVMNGMQFVKELRQLVTLKHTPVLMLTAIANPDAECTLLSHGADDYCEKNVKKKVLLTRVEKLLAKKPKNPLQHMLSD